MKAAFGERFGVRFHGPSARWRGSVTPFEGADTYLIEVEYKIKHVPRVRVLSPELVRKQDGKRLPHTYPDEEGRRNPIRPCLFVPDEWDPRDSIAATIIPWTCEWLLHYEVWLVTGEWRGGGIHPEKKQPIRAQDRAKDYATDSGA
jgi:hypothetical protein